MSDQTPMEVLDERLSDRALSSQRNTPEKTDAFFDCALIAMKAVYRASNAGNVQCKAAVAEMKPKLAILLAK